MEQNKELQTEKWITRHKRAKYTSFMLGSIAVVLALIIGLNVVVGLLADRFNLVLDFTSDSRFTLSDESTEFVKTIEVPVNIYVLNNRADWEGNEVTAPLLNMLKSYTVLNDRIKLSYVDLDSNPTFKNKYPKLDLAENDIVVESDYRYYKIDQTSLVSYFNYENYYTNNGDISYSSNAENAMTGALVSVSSKTQPVVYFLTGNGESEEDNSSFIELLNMNSYSVETVNLVTSEIPTRNSEDQAVDFLAIVNPTVDFTDSQIKKIDAFLRNDGEYGKQLIYFGSDSTPSLPNLNAYLAEWGVSVKSGVMQESDTNYVVSADAGTSWLLYNTEDEEIAAFTGDLNDKLRYNGTFPGQNLSVLFGQKQFITTHTLLQYSKGVLYDLDENGNKSQAAVQPTAFPAAILAEKVFIGTDGYEKSASNVVVFGSNLASGSLLSTSTVANEEYIVNTFNTLIHKEETVHVSTRIVSNNELSVTSTGAIFLGLIFAIAIPLFVLAIGLVIWLRRRKL